MKTTVCGKCSGLGVIRVYGHIANGVCFQCNGLGYVRGKNAVYQVSQKQITCCFFGFNKREMKIVIDDSLIGCEYFECIGGDIDYDKFARCGLYKRIEINNTVRYIPLFTRSQLAPLYDLSR